MSDVPYLLVRELEHSLAECMVLRADGTLHARSCMNAQVNSVWYTCSPACVEAQKARSAARAWLEYHKPSVPKLRAPQRPHIVMEVGRELFVAEALRIDAQDR
jgi:hypothetical protein